MKSKEDMPALAKRYAAVQEPILEEARFHFVPAVVQALRCVVRLVVECEDYLERVDIDAPDPDELDYVGGSVFSGTASFADVGHAYAMLERATRSTIGWGATSKFATARSLRETYLTMYQEFEALDVKTHFEDKCRLVLDMFKLQLVFVGIVRNW